jgi:copper transporter 1
MLFTWSTENLCIVFRGWQITSTFSLIWSLLAIVALGAGYELVRNITREYEARAAARLESIPRKSTLDSMTYMAAILHWLSTTA